MAERHRRDETLAGNLDHIPVEIGESVEIRKSPKTAKIVELEGYDPYDVLARKLGWSGSNVR